MSIVTAIASLKSAAPYSQSRPYTDPPKGDHETNKDYEARTWRERCHADAKGNVIVPPMTFKNCLSEAAKYLGMKIPGKGKSTYTKHFEAGVMVITPLTLPIKKADIVGEWLYLNADGRRGSGTRVWKCYPVVAEWEGDVEFTIVDPAITEDVFSQHIVEAGKYIGIGRFRPRNNGFYGRFTLEGLKWNHN